MWSGSWIFPDLTQDLKIIEEFQASIGLIIVNWIYNSDDAGE